MRPNFRDNESKLLRQLCTFSAHSVHIQCTTVRHRGGVAHMAIPKHPAMLKLGAQAEFLLHWLQPPGQRFKRADTLVGTYQTPTDVPVFPPDTSRGRLGGVKGREGGECE